jgi:hypothetical protein
MELVGGNCGVRFGHSCYPFGFFSFLLSRLVAYSSAHYGVCMTLGIKAFVFPSLGLGGMNVFSVGIGWVCNWIVLLACVGIDQSVTGNK